MAEGQYFVRSTEADAPSASLLLGEDEIWREADRIIWGPADYRTSFRALWTPETLGGLHLRFDVRDPDPWHTIEKRDDPLWDEEVVEIFLDLDGSGTHYAEVELSPANVTCDVRMIQGSPDKKMDLAWELVGLSTRVFRREDGWSGLLFLPWEGLRSLPSAWTIALPPEKGDRWRFNVYRIERPGGTHCAERKRRVLGVFANGKPELSCPGIVSRIRVRMIVFALLLLTLSSVASAQVRVWEEDVVIPTYPLAPDDVNPHFFALEGSVIYPYTMQDNLTPVKVDRTYRAWFLENEYLKLMALPEIGGRIQYVYDKRRGEEMFYHNRVIRPGHIALRGAWVSGGIEWNRGRKGIRSRASLPSTSSVSRIPTVPRHSSSAISR